MDVIGAERIPRTGPLIVAANHHNALVDGVLLLATLPRRLVSVAKAPLFSNPLIGPFLRVIGALPVHRRQEVPLRTGAARMLLAAEADAAGPVTLLPVGLMLHEPGTFRTGRALIAVGLPVETAILLGGLPLALWGLAGHAVPYWLTWAAAKLLRPEPDVEATYKLVAGVVIYPLAWVAEGWLLWRGGAGWLLALFVALLIPGGFFALAWGERRRAVLDEMERAVARVPEPVLAGREGA